MGKTVNSKDSSQRNQVLLNAILSDIEKLAETLLKFVEEARSGQLEEALKTLQQAFRLVDKLTVQMVEHLNMSFNK